MFINLYDRVELFFKICHLGSVYRIAVLFHANVLVTFLRLSR